MHIDVLMPCKYLRAAEFQGREVTVTISSYQQEEVGSKKEDKLVLYFAGVPKGLVLNRTNANRIAAIYGTEVDHWIGKPVVLFPTTTEMGGKTVECIRVRERMPTMGQPTQQQQPPVGMPAAGMFPQQQTAFIPQQQPAFNPAQTASIPSLFAQPMIDQRQMAAPAAPTPQSPQITPEMLAAVQAMLARQQPPQTTQGNAAVGAAASPTFQGSVPHDEIPY